MVGSGRHASVRAGGQYPRGGACFLPTSLAASAQRGGGWGGRPAPSQWRGHIANGGILSLDSSLTSGGNQTLGGTATINLNDAGARLAIDGTGATALGSNVVVRGQGNIGTAINVAGNNLLTNNGLISADVSGGTLNITAPASGGGSSFINNGTLRAINGASLLLSTNITSNTGSQIVAGAGSSVVQNGVTLNGVINASGTGVFTAVSSASNVLNGVNFTGTLDLTSISNSRERIANGATINGAVNIANGGILSLDSSLTSGGNQTLGGTATINLNDAGARLARAPRRWARTSSCAGRAISAQPSTSLATTC
ncbi:MAG: hypothetical protein IPN75_06205 [Dechloromonas sp.]|uniref:S-layer family protein n=1 Tax=Candidatus Dechloromonas phosphorivorans TaxID=2899244 RepID=A0A9D7QIA9_9RHOO|nr:hypothetical protein [Candidatus Dechloromonas phosphorivorans]